VPKSRIAAAQIDLHWVVHPVDQKRSVLNALDGSRQSARLLPTNLVFSPPPMHCGISDICCLAPNDVSQIFRVSVCSLVCLFISTFGRKRRTVACR